MSETDIKWAVPASENAETAANHEEELARAMWEGDVDRLRELAGCDCCCADHTFEGCPARTWGGCRGQDSMTRTEEKSWLRHYVENHGMTEAQFYGTELAS